jgi:hypothetical protein
MKEETLKLPIAVTNDVYGSSSSMGPLIIQ